MSDSLESQAASLGIPLHIVIDDRMRYSSCDAHAANLASIEGTQAIYQGECAMGHHYDMEFEIEELKKMAHIENGELVFGDKKGFVSDGLEEF